MFGFEEKVYMSTSLKVLGKSVLLFGEGLGWEFFVGFEHLKTLPFRSFVIMFVNLILERES